MAKLTLFMFKPQDCIIENCMFMKVYFTEHTEKKEFIWLLVFPFYFPLVLYCHLQAVNFKLLPKRYPQEIEVHKHILKL